MKLSVAFTSCTGAAIRIVAALVATSCFAEAHAASEAQPLIWLKTANYAALDNYLEALQRRYEAGGVSERRLYDGFRALYEDGTDNARYFDRWVRAYPSSYAARTARGAYYYRMAGFVRGDKFIRQTPAQNIQGMFTYLARARPDLYASLNMTSSPI